MKIRVRRYDQHGPGVVISEGEALANNHPEAVQAFLRAVVDHYGPEQLDAYIYWKTPFQALLSQGYLVEPLDELQPRPPLPTPKEV